MNNNYFSLDLIEKYKMAGPRYTSYPTAVQFNNEFKAENYIEELKLSNQGNKDLSFYFHIPFCQNVCYYCACNKIITKNKTQAEEYLNYLYKDIKMQTDFINQNRPLMQIHFGGGTPTFIAKEHYGKLWDYLTNNFNLSKEGEFSIEIDPRTIDYDYLKFLKNLGLNRLSFGIQDFNLEVQKEVNRIQPLEMVEKLFNQARQLNFSSISVDLIYGLPKQSSESFLKTIEEIIKLSPDRLAVFNYAHLPDLFGAQKQIKAELLPNYQEKLKILANCIAALTNADYEFIGLDHFAKKTDSLVYHQQNGSLYRNFQGYSTFANCDLLGFGISSISQVNNCYSQNFKARDKYYNALDNNLLPVSRGIILNDDDKIRRFVITEIMCNLKLDLDVISQKFNIDAVNYFKEEWENLNSLEADNLIKLEEKKFYILDLGRLLIRNIAMTFDNYLKQQKNKFSQVI